MTWVKIDENMPQHPKLAAAGPLAFAMQVAALCYSNRHLTDGFIPWSVANTLFDWRFLERRSDGELVCSIDIGCGMSGETATCARVIEQLVAHGIWDEISGGYLVHDFEKYQPTKAQVLAEREAKRSAGQAGGKARAQALAKADAKQTPKQNASNGSSKIVAKFKPDPDPDPASPDPLPDQNPSAAVVALTRASACNSSSHISPETDPDSDLGEDESRFGPEPYAGLSSRGVAAIWLRITGLAHVTQRALTAFADMARIAEQAAGAGQARQAVLVGVAWIVHGPDGPVRTKRVRLNGLTPWLVAERFANDLEAANAWWHDGGREYWQKLSSPPKAAEASQ